ncbi:hypothetical protein K438DRAFT_1776672 [Mycena galopus ATCC 62051]|nr:hypothetical protein K438DRAFT_1776672 [Mycena galopus ATCC 62051]
MLVFECSLFLLLSLNSNVLENGSFIPARRFYKKRPRLYAPTPNRTGRLRRAMDKLQTPHRCRPSASDLRIGDTVIRDHQQANREGLRTWPGIERCAWRIETRHIIIGSKNLVGRLQDTTEQDEHEHEPAKLMASSEPPSRYITASEDPPYNM